ncbi:MAG: hypothetical protein K0S08_2085 [Gammaproteobacteria bacterium]|jgi:hypothetical protein|nr:hypothetical protein [Gammaproteobacteria bacterium]
MLALVYSLVPRFMLRDYQVQHMPLKKFRAKSNEVADITAEEMPPCSFSVSSRL